MARWTQTWLTGLGTAGVQTHDDRVAPGVRLGLPADGAGSAVGFGPRAGAFAIDAVLCGLVARLLFPVQDTGHAQTSTGLAPLVALAFLYIVGVTLTGQTIGMRLLKLRVVPVTAPATVPGLVPVALRTALLMLLVPAVISDRDGRGLHDRAAGTVIVRT